MGAVQKLECIQLRVDEVDSVLEFYTEVMGLVELERDEEVTYLGCGLDKRYDLAIQEGNPGLESFAMRVSDDEFEQHAASLDEHDVESYERSGPGHERGLYFELPESGMHIGLVVVEDNRYQHSAGTSEFLDSTAPVATDRAAITPTDIDHVAITCPDVEREARFLEKVAGFRVSDAQIADDAWRNAFVRLGLHHHDIALFSGEPEENPDHVAWATRDVTQMELFADRLAQHDYQLSKPFTKHGPGANVAIYFHEPSGHRFEYNTGMATLEHDCPEGIYERSERKGGSSLWGGH